MIEIPDPPRQTECTLCWRPLSWLWSPKRNGWVALVRDVSDPEVAREHRCPLRDERRDWRQAPLPFSPVDPRAATRARAGRALVNEALAAARATQSTQKEPEHDC